MPRFSWSGLPTLQWSRRADAVEGLVLAGGGSRASFQIGALRYLYERAGIKPSTIVGTSAGAILTAMLGQSLDADDQAAAVRRLEELWFEMRRQSDMFTERPWFTTLQARGQEWMALLSSEQRAAQARSPLATRLLAAGRRAKPADATEPLAETPVAETPLAETLVDDTEQLSGQAETLRIAMHENTPEGTGFSPALVMQLMSSLPRLRGAPGDLGAILRGAEASRSMYHPGPLLEKLLDEGTFQSAKVASSGVVVRIATVCLETGGLKFMREDGRLVDRDDRLIPGSTQHDFSRGVLASCSIPAVFAPVELDGDFHVDGGVRENVPAEMAIGQLGVDRCWVITSSPTDEPPRESYATKSMAQVMMRATQILTDETERDEIAYARSAGAKVIEPEIAVHDALQIDPGLIRINRDHGWMRAAEAHLEIGEGHRLIHRRLIELRLRAHRLEASRFLPTATSPTAEKPSATEADLRELASIKLEIADLIGRAHPEALPEGHDRWSTHWEEHARTPRRRPPWLSAASSNPRG